MWRDTGALPEDLIFRVNYLGGDMPTFALNFSRPGAQVVAQYYNFLRLGFDGYRRVQQYCGDVATSLSARIAGMGPFRLLTRGDELPVFAFTFPDNRTDLSVLRVVVRNGMTHDLADLFADHLTRVVGQLSRQEKPLRGKEASGFAHGAR